MSSGLHYKSLFGGPSWLHPVTLPLWIFLSYMIFFLKQSMPIKCKEEKLSLWHKQHERQCFSRALGNKEFSFHWDTSVIWLKVKVRWPLTGWASRAGVLDQGWLILGDWAQDCYWWYLAQKKGSKRTDTEFNKKKIKVILETNKEVS